ncbi:extracellular solute-binding protein [Jeotgalibaca sp. MA1X17-3]|uniref:extracellular solute-binding protein n=1 Tax=Jeotgalibaca sp. MA1X17-3 TaxID=2908211 RepID=UPI001F43FF98|nr:extracellular solute-binding protein [Jeotgalibaca sp. MA1X17-3]UJF15670.1 extracellular solute-binding protein [Jeotgalibaca sp. MA1X17-3]
MKRSKRFGMFTSVLTASILLAACGGDGAGDTADSVSKGNNNTSDTSSSVVENTSTKDSVSWMAMLHTPTPPSGEVESKLEEYTGVDIEFNWVPDASKEERINAALASNTLADIVSLTQISNTTVRQSLSSGMFWDVEPYLSEFENLSNISEATLDASRIDGHIYGVPFQKPIARYATLVRKDWLENLGLDVPHTMDELKEVARAFTEDDPDGNGQDDTVGFVDRAESVVLGFRTMTGFFGADNYFHVTEDEEVIPSFMQPEYKEAMEWYRDIYKNDWMNSDFAVMAKNDQKDYIATGKGGIVVSGAYDANNYLSATAGTDQEDIMDWEIINDMTYKDVPRRVLSDTNGGMGGWLAIPKTNVETEEDLKVVLQFINDLIDEEPFTLMTQGVEGVHYEISDDGVYNKLDDTLWQQEVQPFAGSRPSELVTTFKAASELTNLSNEKIAENAEFAVINPAQSLNSETYTSDWSTLVEGVEDAYYKYMMGEIEMDGFDAAVEKFLQNGGQNIIDEYSASYKENK